MFYYNKPKGGFYSIVLVIVKQDRIVLILNIIKAQVLIKKICKYKFIHELLFLTRTLIMRLIKFHLYKNKKQIVYTLLYLRIDLIFNKRFETKKKLKMTNVTDFESKDITFSYLKSESTQQQQQKKSKLFLVPFKKLYENTK